MCVVASSSKTKLNAFPFLSYMLYMGFHFFFFYCCPREYRKKAISTYRSSDANAGNADREQRQRRRRQRRRRRRRQHSTKVFHCQMCKCDKRDREAENFWRGSGKWSQKLYDDIMGKRDRSGNVLVICKWYRLNFVYDMNIKSELLIEVAWVIDKYIIEAFYDTYELWYPWWYIFCI